MEQSIRQSNNGKSNGKVQINGHEYLTVAYRLAAFRAKYPIETGWAIETDCVQNNEAQVTFKAAIKTPEGKTVATGHASEKRDSSYINKTSAYENCETSALGRALANAGFIGSEFASADEVALAIRAQAELPTMQGGQASQAKAKPQPAQGGQASQAASPVAAQPTPAQPAQQPSQAAKPGEVKHETAKPNGPTAKPAVEPGQATALEPCQAKQAVKPPSQAARQAQTCQPQGQAKPSGQAGPAKPQGKDAAQPDEETAEKWTRENLAEWLDTPCLFGKAEGRTWRQLAENRGEKIFLKDKPSQPRAYLHAIESWQNCGVWLRMKARVALEVGKNGTDSN
jgi:outer membrane biosynthesis protein TonB